jgi:hypothetical protein
MEHVFFLSESGEKVLSISREGVRIGEDCEVKLVFEKAKVSAEHFNLLRSSPLLYQQLTYQYTVLQVLLEQLDGLPNTESLQRSLTDAQNAIMLTQRAALEGIEKVADELSREEPKQCPR